MQTILTNLVVSFNVNNDDGQENQVNIIRI